MKKIWNYALMAVLTVGLSLAATSCKSDDNDDNNNHPEEREDIEGDTTLEECQLATIIAKFAGLQDYELMQTTGWQQKTYEAKLGLVMDESRPTVRSIKAGTVEDADERAIELLDILGINSQNPDGFTFSDASVGTVSYQHGGGDDNTVAVINIDVKQLPGITQLRMVKDMGDNAGFGYYSVGDIIEKDGRLWLCIQEASALGDEAIFLTFHDQHRTDNPGWYPYNDITYHNKDGMASYSTLSNWISLFLTDDYIYNMTVSRVKEKGKSGSINDILPGTQDERKRLVELMMDDPLNLTETQSFLDKFKWEELTATGTNVAPYGMLLCDKFRWAPGIKMSYWMPYISIQPKSLFGKEKYQSTASQNSSKFQFLASNPSDLSSETLKPIIGEDKFIIVKLAAYWQHVYYGPDKKQWSVFDFTKDWSKHPDSKIASQFSDRPWTNRCNTSRQMVHIDNNNAIAGATNVYVNSQEK